MISGCSKCWLGPNSPVFAIEGIWRSHIVSALASVFSAISIRNFKPGTRWIASDEELQHNRMGPISIKYANTSKLYTYYIDRCMLVVSWRNCTYFALSLIHAQDIYIEGLSGCWRTNVLQFMNDSGKPEGADSSWWKHHYSACNLILGARACVLRNSFSCSILKYNFAGSF